MGLTLLEHGLKFISLRNWSLKQTKQILKLKNDLSPQK